MDQKLEQRIWERVAGTEKPRSTLRGMELRCREAAAVFRTLAAQAAGENREQLRKLAQMEHSNAMTLQGMRILDGEEPEQTSFPPQKINPRRALAQSFRRSCEALEDYAARSLAGEYSAVFARMHADETAIQAMTLGLIAGMRKGI